MIPCQRDMFDIPENITYLNCAYTSPLLKAAQEAGRAAIQAKANPWTITSGDFFSNAGTPLEENWFNRAGSEDFSRLVDYRASYQTGARRYDQGEASSFILAPIAAAGIRQILDWGVANISETLQNKTNAIADRAQHMGLDVAPARTRAPHLIGVSKPGGFRKDLPQLLAQENIFVSVRGDSVRISPHLFSSEEDIERLFTVLEQVAGKKGHN